MGGSTGMLLYFATVVLIVGIVVLTDVTRSISVTDTSVSVRTFGVTTTIPLEDVRHVVTEQLDDSALRVVVLGRRPWRSVRVYVTTGSREAEDLRRFLGAAEKLGASVSKAPLVVA